MDGQQCDRCNAPSQVKIDLLRSARTLYFCRHHTYKYFPQIRTGTDAYPGMLFTLEKV